jgi:hypothetical protein
MGLHYDLSQLGRKLRRDLSASRTILLEQLIYLIEYSGQEQDRVERVKAFPLEMFY